MGGTALSERLVRERVTAIVAGVAPLETAELSGESLLVADLGYDSLALWELLAALDRDFGFTIAPDGEEIETVADVEALVLESLRNQGGVRDGTSRAAG